MPCNHHIDERHHAAHRSPGCQPTHPRKSHIASCEPICGKICGTWSRLQSRVDLLLRGGRIVHGTPTICGCPVGLFPITHKREAPSEQDAHKPGLNLQTKSKNSSARAEPPAPKTFSGPGHQRWQFLGAAPKKPTAQRIWVSLFLRDTF